MVSFAPPKAFADLVTPLHERAAIRDLLQEITGHLPPRTAPAARRPAPTPEQPRVLDVGDGTYVLASQIVAVTRFTVPVGCRPTRTTQGMRTRVLLLDGRELYTRTPPQEVVELWRETVSY